MKSVSDVMLLSVSDAGGGRGQCDGTAKLQLQVEKDNLVSITTTYPKLDTPDAAAGDDGDQESPEADVCGSPAREASARMEVKRLLKVLASLAQVSGQIIDACE